MTHNPDRPSLEERAAEAASRATCARCKVVILDDSSGSGVVLGRLIVPLLGIKHAYQMCGKCGLALREFIFPDLDRDPVYQECKRKLLTEFWT